MPLPNFLGVGAQKAGTTTLYDILRQHPDIYLPAVKETKFFTFEERYSRGMDYYLGEYFSEWDGESAIGEIDPGYMFFEQVAARLKTFLGPDIKLIFLLRDPVDRAYSHYWMTYRRGIEDLPFAEAVEKRMSTFINDHFHNDHFSYIQRGQYLGQIKRMLEFFPKQNMLFVIFEDELLQNTAVTIERILSFLEVRPMDLDLTIKSNSRVVPRSKLLEYIIDRPSPLKKIGRFFVPAADLREKMIRWVSDKNNMSSSISGVDPSLRQYLFEKYFLADIEQLEELLGRDLTVWQSNNTADIDSAALSHYNDNISL